MSLSCAGEFVHVLWTYWLGWVLAETLKPSTVQRKRKKLFLRGKWSVPNVHAWQFWSIYAVIMLLLSCSHHTVFNPVQDASRQQSLASQSRVVRLEQKILTMKAEQEAVLSSMGEEVDAVCCSLLKNGQRNLKVFIYSLCCAASRPAGVRNPIQITTQYNTCRPLMELIYLLLYFSLRLALKAALTDGQQLVVTGDTPTRGCMSLHICICHICYVKYILANTGRIFKIPTNAPVFHSLFWLMTPARSYLLIDSLIQANGAAARRTRKRLASSAICHVQKKSDCPAIGLMREIINSLVCR